MQVKRIVCLANSFKTHGHCLAGKEYGGTGRWIRPVRGHQTHELFDSDVRYTRASRMALPLDVMEVRLCAASPHFYQQENWLIETVHPPLRVLQYEGAFPWDSLHTIQDKPTKIWIDGDSSTAGVNDRVPEEVARLTIRTSLLLIGLEEFRMIVGQPGLRFGDHAVKVQGEFVYAGSRHRLQVTDPLAFQYAKGLGMGAHEIGRTFLTLSLGEAYKGHCYKLIACVLPREPLWTH